MSKAHTNEGQTPDLESDRVDKAFQQAQWVRAQVTLAQTTDSGVAGLAADSVTGYEILRELHRGGQGVVYLAIQQSTSRKVALKVMREGPFAGAADRARFEREVQVLGQLNHPHIVAIHDSGAVAGHHYFVMDYVPGQPLDVYMACGERSVEETLNLFAAICEAVNAAHLRAVIHRDLKPSNIRVDSEGQPHILDFGLAKVATSAADASGMTLTGQFVGSLPWASPEQAEGAPSKIDVRTDVYSLGVILYQMLTGRFPYDVTGNMRDALDNILSVEPVRPSVVPLPGGARTGRLNDEIDTIVLKCLSKERERRYQTAGELGRDVRHYLNGEPIEAKRDSTGYVLRKQLTKYKLPVAVAVGFFVVITAGLLTSLVLWQQASTERDRTREALKLAEQRQEETQQVADFQSRMLSEIDVEAMGRGMKQRFREQVRAALERQYVGEYPERRKRTPEEIEAELAAYDERAGVAQAVDVARHVMDEYVLQHAAEALEEEFGDQPLVQAQVQTAIGNTYKALGAFDKAEPYLRNALALRQRELGPQHETVATSLDDLSNLMWQKGDYDAAEALLREALATLRELLGDAHPDVAKRLHNLAVLLRSKGEYVASEALCSEALALQRKALGNEHPDVATTLNSLGLTLHEAGDNESAESLIREALGLQRRLLGDEHLDVAASLLNLAGLLGDRGDYAGADLLCRQALAIHRKLLGHEHPNVATSLNKLAQLLYFKGDYAAADELLRESLALRRALLGDAHPSVARNLNDLAQVREARGDYAAAEPLLRESLAMSRRLLGDAHPDVSTSLNNLASLLKAKGDYAAAEPLYRESLALRREFLGDENPAVATSLSNLAGLLMNRGDLSGAESLYREALDLHRKLWGDEHPAVATNLNGLANLLVTKGDYAGAEPLLRESLALFRKLLGNEHPAVATALNNLGGVLHQMGDYAAAEPFLREAQELRRKLLGDEHPAVAMGMHNLAQLLWGKGDLEEAESLHREALALRRKTLGDEHPELAQSLNNLAVLLNVMGNYTAAEPLFREALTLRRKLLGDTHPETLFTMTGLGQALTQLGRFAEAEATLLNVAEVCEHSDAHLNMRWKSVLARFAELYEAWHAAEPDQGHDAKAAEWRAKLEAWQASTQPAD